MTLILLIVVAVVVLGAALAYQRGRRVFNRGRGALTGRWNRRI